MAEAATTEATESAAAATETATEAQATEAPAEKVDGEDALGDKGKKALDTMKAERKQAREEAAAEKARADALQAKLEGKEAEYTAAQEAQKVRDEAIAAANTRILNAEFRAAAAGKLNDPADALRYIETSDFEVSQDGAVDGAAIAKAVEDLIAEKPYLAAQSGKRFQGTADGGARNDATKPSQLTKADLAAMSPQQIDQAHADGRLTDLLGSK